MIHVSHLTKQYPGRTAVNDVSFTVGRGEIVGFLGPNGAGKSTTMRMLAGYLPATGGAIRVAGFDVATHPLEVRQRIGYLPENCPLYPDMRVDEYLAFRARLKRVAGRHLRSRLAEVKNLCGIGDVGRRIIGQLSKGYRQRVGLAESLIHDPERLILDEPGPTQRVRPGFRFSPQRGKPRSLAACAARRLPTDSAPVPWTPAPA